VHDESEPVIVDVTLDRLSYHTYRGYEYGKFFPAAEVLYKIAVILNVSSDYILGLSTIEDADETRGVAIGTNYHAQIKSELKARRLPTGDFVDMVLGLSLMQRWVLQDGSLVADARFVEISDNTVRLQKKDGTIVDVQKEQLCQNNQDWLDMVLSDKVRVQSGKWINGHQKTPKTE
jgi:transcriptional regulator with XRE-family HTH domain